MQSEIKRSCVYDLLYLKNVGVVQQGPTIPSTAVHLDLALLSSPLGWIVGTWRVENMGTSLYTSGIYQFLIEMKCWHVQSHPFRTKWTRIVLSARKLLVSSYRRDVWLTSFRLRELMYRCTVTKGNFGKQILNRSIYVRSRRNWKSQNTRLWRRSLTAATGACTVQLLFALFSLLSLLCTSL